MSRIHPLSKLIAVFVLTCFGAVVSLGQTSVQEFRNVLRDKASFTADDFSALERGEMVVNLLPVNDKREVAVCGLMRLQLPLAVALQSFQDSMSQLNRKSILQSGKFSSSPSLEDLQGLTMDNRDIEDLKRCVVGECELKMSAAMIERFRKDVDWTSPDYQTQSTRFYRQMLLDYVKDYLARGDSALIEYHDQSRSIRLEEEHRSLLEASVYINDFAPELTNYLKGFPRPELTDVKNEIKWTKLKFGLKPVTMITHVATYTRQTNGVPQILVVSKQLYANHYFDSALALTALINIPTAGATSDSYLLYTNRSRADALDGSFSKLRRKLVEREAVDSLNALLLQTRLNLEARSENQVGPSEPSGRQKLFEWLFGGKRLFWWLLAIIVLTASLGLRKRYSKRNVASFENNR